MNLPGRNFANGAVWCTILLQFSTLYILITILLLVIITILLYNIEVSRSKYHYAIRFAKKNEEIMRKNAMAHCISENKHRD